MDIDGIVQMMLDALEQAIHSEFNTGKVMSNDEYFACVNMIYSLQYLYREKTSEMNELLSELCEEKKAKETE